VSFELSIEQRVATLEAVRQEHLSQWVRLLSDVSKINSQLQTIVQNVSVIQCTLDLKITTLDRELADIENKVDKLPRKALAAGSLLVGILVGIGQLAGLIKF